MTGKGRSILKTNGPIVPVRVSRSREKMRYSRLTTYLLKYSFFRLLRKPLGISTRLTYRVSVHKRYMCPAVGTNHQGSKCIHVASNIMPIIVVSQDFLRLIDSIHVRSWRISNTKSSLPEKIGNTKLSLSKEIW